MSKEQKKTKKEEAKKMEKKLCQQCLNPDQKGVCSCHSRKKEEVSKGIKQKFGVPVADDSVMGALLRKPELLTFRHSPVGKGRHIVFLGGSVKNNSIRFANEHGTFIVKRGEKTSWSKTGKKSGTLTVADSHHLVNHEKSFSVKSDHILELLKKAIAAYNKWARPQEEAQKFSCPAPCHDKSVIDEMSEAIEKEEKSVVPSFSIDSFIGKLRHDAEFRQKSLALETADCLEQMALKIRKEGARMEMMEDIIEMLKEDQKKVGTPLSSSDISF
jgi:hypothetical protein